MICPNCDGDGNIPCEFCHGSQVVTCDMGHDHDCEECFDGFEDCFECDGEGEIEDEDEG